MATFETPGRFIATIPYSLGYEPSESNILAIPLADDGTVKEIAVLKWNDDPDIAFRLSDTLAHAYRGVCVERYVLIGYGPEGGIRAQRLDNLLVTSHNADASVLIHVENGIMSVKMPEDRNWSARTALPDVAAEHAIAGRVTPAASLVEMTHRYEPLQRPLFAELSADAAHTLDRLSPALRAEVALRALDQLAEPHGDDVGKMATLAHLVATAEPVVRDTILVDATQTEARAEVLGSTFRAAPSRLRAAIAPVAAGAMYMTGYPQQAVAKVLTYADPNGPNARLGELLRLSIRAGIPPATMRGGLPAAEVRSALDTADESWHAARTNVTRRAASIPAATATEVATRNPFTRGVTLRGNDPDLGHAL